MKSIHIIRLVFLSMRHHLNLVMRKYEAKPKQDCAKLIQSCPTLCDYMDCRLPGSLSMGFFRQEYWSGLPCPPPADLLTQGSNPLLLLFLHWQAFSLLESSGKPLSSSKLYQNEFRFCLWVIVHNSWFKSLLFSGYTYDLSSQFSG